MSRNSCATTRVSSPTVKPGSPRAWRTSAECQNCSCPARHSATEAYPSRTDISYANEPGAHYVLVSTRDPDTVEFRSFRIVDGTVTEEEVRITD